MVKGSTVALVGSDSLLGREIRDIVSTSALEIDLRLVASDEETAGVLTRVGDEPTVVGGLELQNLSDVQAIVLTGSVESNRRALELAGDSVPVIDLTYTAEDNPEARLRAPVVESGERFESAVHVIAHPAAIAIALFLRRLHAQEGIRRAIVQIFAPASERGTNAVEELQQQTVDLLSFKPLPRAVFDAQIAFNLLPRYGEEAPLALEETELRIERHLATLLDLPGEGQGAPMPSVRLIQAPVFHGYSISAWVEFESDPGVEALESSLSSPSIDVRSGEFEPPTNVGQAGQGGIAVGAITPDRNAADACWFWIVADNVRLMAENAVAVAQQIV